MSRVPITEVRSRTIALPQQNIDTDQIIPARFLTTIERQGLGRHAFADWRAAGGCPLDDDRAAGCEILVAGENFGCGSSREHAPWALLDFGLRAVISSSFADIFQQNAHKNGLLTVPVDAEILTDLLAAPWSEVSIDVRERTVTIDGRGTIPFPLDDFAHHCLLEGLDELAYLLEFEPAITAYETERETC